jgi:hypothetical protein
VFPAADIASGNKELSIIENCVFLGYYAVNSSNSLPAFQDNLLIPYSRIRPLKMGLIVCPETSVRNYHYSLHNNPEEHSSHSLHVRSWKSCIVITGFASCTHNIYCRGHINTELHRKFLLHIAHFKVLE